MMLSQILHPDNNALIVNMFLIFSCKLGLKYMCK